MKKMPEFAKAEVVSCLHDLANQRLQEYSWVRGIPAGPASPEELISQLFDDTNLSDYLSASGVDCPVFSARVDSILREISVGLEYLDLGIPLRALLRGVSWRNIQQKASDALALINEATDPNQGT